MARSKSSKRWLEEHFDDHFVKMAQEQGLRSRSAFKLLELHEKYELIKPAMVVIDLGAAPGGWCQVAAPLVGKSGRVIALDILDMDPLANVEFIKGDFTEDEPLRKLESALDGAQCDLVMSDMAPNMSGMAVIDQAKSMYLAELALDFAIEHLRPGGSLLVKAFQGRGFDEFVQRTRSCFASIQITKPKASRPRSREVYLLARKRRVE